jgi:hypothetical protein
MSTDKTARFCTSQSPVKTALDHVAERLKLVGITARETVDDRTHE